MMRWDWVVFALSMAPLMINIIIFVSGRSDEVWNRKRQRRKLRSAEMNALLGGIKLLLVSLPFFAAFYYADLAWLWLGLAVVCAVCGFVLLIMGSVVLYARKSGLKEIEQAQAQARKTYAKVNFWPKWQVHALCAINLTVLILWIYAWRYLFAM